MRPGETPPIAVDGDPRVVLRPSASAQDVEFLRTWKNAHRTSFFDQSEITRAQQAIWFKDLCRRDDDFMYMVDVDGQTVGCMGFRRIGQVVDFYNIIRGVPPLGGPWVMSRALQALLRAAFHEFALPVTGKVLRSNPALAWYAANDCLVVGTEDTHYVLEWMPAHGASGAHEPEASGERSAR